MKSSRLLEGVRRAASRAALGSVVALLAAGGARADSFDTSMPHVVVVGSPKGAAPADRVDGARSGRARNRLPSAPAQLWSHRVSGGIELAPLVDEAGAVLLALGVPDVVKLSRDGAEVFRSRIGPQAALAAPVLTSSGQIVVATAGGSVVGLSSGGALRFSTMLGAKGREEGAAPVALRDGGVVVALGRALFELGEDGSVRARATLDDRPMGALVDGGDAVLVTTDSGAVYSWRPPELPKKLGAFGGAVRRSAAVVDARELVAVVDSRRLVSLDLTTSALHVRASASPLSGFFDGPPATGSGLAYVASQSGFLLGVDAVGNERLRAALDKPQPLSSSALPMGQAAAAATFFGTPDAKPSPPVLVDDMGRVAFARADGRVGVVSPEGVVTLATEQACKGPVALAPAGDQRFVVACRDGNVLCFGD